MRCRRNGSNDAGGGSAAVICAERSGFCWLLRSNTRVSEGEAEQRRLAAGGGHPRMKWNWTLDHARESTQLTPAPNANDPLGCRRRPSWVPRHSKYALSGQRSSWSRCSKNHTQAHPWACLHVQLVVERELAPLRGGSLPGGASGPTRTGPATPRRRGRSRLSLRLAPPIDDE